MGNMGHGYGSEYHLLRCMGRYRNRFNEAVARMLAADEVDWLDVPSTGRKSGSDGEWKGLSFLPEGAAVRETWRRVWPTSGNPPNWDAVGKARIRGEWEWLLVEAKANEQELESSCAAVEHGGRPMIVSLLEHTKKELGVAPNRDWLDGYYQYANRLSVLNFLLEQNVPAHLLFVYFVGDKGDARRTCPRCEADWMPALMRRNERMGVPERHRLSDRVHSMFLDANRLSTRRPVAYRERGSSPVSGRARSTSETKQVILEVGAEGGSITLFGCRSGQSWQFQVETNESALLDEDDRFETPQRPRVTHWPAALAQLDHYPWAQLYPLAVHPSFNQQVLAALTERERSGSAIRWPDRWYALLR